MKPHRSLATLLAWVFAVLIAYASLYPFAQWRDQGVPAWSFLFAPWPKYWGRFDTAANFLGYMPLGFLWVVSLLRTSLIALPVLWVSLSCAAFSLCLEMLQTYLPMRVPSLADWLLNSAGALLGAYLAVWAERLGFVDHWSQWRRRWFVNEARAPLGLLLLWPIALLFPSAAPLNLGQVHERLILSLGSAVEGTQWANLMDSTPEFLPLSGLGELFCVALGLLIPCLLAYSVTLEARRRAIILVAICAVSMGASALSASMSFSPEHAWSWLTQPALAGWLLGMGLALGILAIPRRMAVALLLMILVWQLVLINSVPSTPYYAQTLQNWEQGRFIRFHGLAQWLSWLWPYAALLVALNQIGRKITKP